MSEETQPIDQKAYDSERGYSFTEWDWLASKDPEYEVRRRHVNSLVFTPEDPELPVKYREMIIAAVLAYKNFPTCEVHLRRAIREGATLTELIQAMQSAAVPGGAPTLHHVIPDLMKIDEDIQAGRDV